MPAPVKVTHADGRTELVRASRITTASQPAPTDRQFAYVRLLIFTKGLRWTPAQTRSGVASQIRDARRRPSVEHDVLAYALHATT